MYKKIRLIPALIILIFCFALPLNASSFSLENVNSYLKKGSTEDLMDIMRKKPLAQANFDLFYDSILGYDSNAPRKTGAVVLVKQAILKKQLDYWFKDMPEQLSIKFIKNTFAVVSIIYKNDIPKAIKIIEKLSVKKATEYAINWLFQNKLKIGTGELTYSFSSYKKNWQNIKIQYIIAYHSTEQNKGEIVAEFYSKGFIEPPLGTSPNALGGFTDNPNATCWPWDYWLENERNRDNDGKIEPFILRIKGYVTEKNPPLLAIPGINDYTTYSRNDNECNLTLEVDFDNLVPEIENSDFILANPPSETSFKKEIIKILLEKVKSKANFVKDFTLEKANNVKNATVSFFDKFMSSFSKSNSGADISQQIINDGSWQIPLSSPTFDIETTEEEVSKMQKEVEQEIEEILRKENLEESDRERLASLKKMREQLEYIKKTLLGKRKKLEEFLAKQKPEKELLVCSVSDSKYTPERNTIIFNEIAWMGTKNSSNDEWMELKNISKNTIDMHNWQIMDKAGLEDNTKGINIVFENAIMPSNGFFLLERTDDTSVPNVTADLIYTGALNNTNEALYLFDENCQLQDKIEAIPTWGYGSNSSKATMERKTDLSWQTGESSGGTPNTNNSSGSSSENEETTDTEEDEINDSDQNTNTANTSGGSSSNATPAPIFYPILINEIMYNLDGSDDNREWIEIFNSANTSVDLTNWKLYEDGTNHSLGLIQGTNVLSPNQYAVIVDDKNEFLKDFPSYSETIFNSSFSLSNDTEELIIKNQDLFIDSVNYSSTWGADGDGNSLQKITPNLDSDNSNNWKPAPPTPGAINIFPTTTSTSTTATSTSATSTTATSTSATSTIATSTSNYSSNIVISEIQIRDIVSANHDFIELFNPATTSIDISNFQLKKRNANGAEISIRKFPASTTISAQSYLLWTNSDYAHLSGLADTTSTQTLAKDNSIAFLDKDQNIIDAVAWGSSTNPFVENIPFPQNPAENQSLGRIIDVNNNYIDTNNNSQDFELQGPTPTNSQGEKGNVQPPHPVQDFQVISFVNNIVVLNWSTTTDPDTPTSSISYVIYWSKDKEITQDNLISISSTTATTTILTIPDLYYNSTYHFGIQAFDNLQYSSLSTTTPLNIPAETPQWQMYGYDPQQTFRSPYAGPTTSTIKWAYQLQEPGTTQFWTGTAIDQNGTIYVGTKGLLAIKEINSQPIKKWFYDLESRIYQSPVIGQDGTIYIIVANKILAISPAGKLKWEKEVNTSFSDGNPYNNVNLAIVNDILYYAAPQQVSTITKPSLIAINSNNGDTVWDYFLTQNHSTNPASSPIVAKDNTIYISFNKTIFAFDVQGNLKWKKIFLLDENCSNNYNNSIPKITINDNGILYFVVKGTSEHHSSNCGDYCKDSLYAVFQNKIDNSTTSLTQQAIKWRHDDRIESTDILVSEDEEIYVNFSVSSGDLYSCYTAEKLYTINEQGTSTPILVEEWDGKFFTPKILDKSGNIFGTYGTYTKKPRGLILGENRYWPFSADNQSFLFPFSLSKNSVLYATTFYTLYAIGQ